MDERLIKELKALRLQAGETLVLQADRVLCDQDREQIMAVGKQAGIKVVVVDGGLRVAAVQAA